MYPLMVKNTGTGFNASNNILNLSSSLNCYPADYDNIIIYSLYKNGYPKFNLVCTFQDYGTMVFANKIFFNINNDNNVAIQISVQGATYAVTNYDIGIVTLNQTLGENIKNLMEEDRKKANIVLINEDPMKLPPFNCSYVE